MSRLIDAMPVRDEERNKAPTGRPVPVRDFVGKFFLLGLLALAGYKKSYRANAPSRTQEGEAVNRLLLATTDYDKVVRQIFPTSNKHGNKCLVAWEATCLWDTPDISFPGHAVLTSLVKSESPQADIFLTQASENHKEHKRDRRSLTGRRLERPCRSESDEQVPRTFDAWREHLRSIVAPGTICQWLGLDRFNDIDLDVVARSEGSVPYIRERKSFSEFYRLFAGGVLSRGDALHVTLERAPLSHLRDPAYLRDRLPDRIEWVPRDPLVTEVEPKIVKRVALMFGFGCDHEEDVGLTTFDNRVRNSGSALRLAAWEAFAGRRDRDGMAYYGDTLENFAKSYLDLVQSVVAKEEDQLKQGDDRASVFGEFYVDVDQNGIPRYLVQTSRPKGKADEEQAAKTTAAADVTSLRLESRFSNVGGKDANGVGLNVASGQHDLLLFNYCPRHLGDQDHLLCFPTTLLAVNPLAGAGIELDDSSWSVQPIETIDGGHVTVSPLSDGQVRLVRDDSIPWNGLPKTFEDFVPLVRFARADPGAEFDVVLSARVDNNMRLEDQSNCPDPKEVLEIAAEALKRRCTADGNGRVILRTLRAKIAEDLPQGEDGGGSEVI